MGFLVFILLIIFCGIAVGSYLRAKRSHSKEEDAELSAMWDEHINSVQGSDYRSRKEDDDDDDDYDAETYISRGRENKINGDLTAAIENFTKALELDPNKFSVYQLRANAYEERGDHDLAIVDFAQYKKFADEATKNLERFMNS